MTEAMQQLAEKLVIQEAIVRYARAVDRADWSAVRAAYHPDAFDDHGSFKGCVDDLIDYLRSLLANSENGMHLLGNCMVELAGPDLALAETYFISQRLRMPEESEECGPDDRICRLGWGRYVDRFERRDGEWRVARRIVTMDAIFSVLARDAVRGGVISWGTRDDSDPLVRMQAEIFGSAS